MPRVLIPFRVSIRQIRLSCQQIQWTLLGAVIEQQENPETESNHQVNSVNVVERDSNDNGNECTQLGVRAFGTRTRSDFLSPQEKTFLFFLFLFIPKNIEEWRFLLLLLLLDLVNSVVLFQDYISKGRSTSVAYALCYRISILQRHLLFYSKNLIVFSVYVQPNHVWSILTLVNSILTMYHTSIKSDFIGFFFIYEMNMRKMES